MIRRQLRRLQDALLVRLPALTGENYMASVNLLGVEPQVGLVGGLQR